MKNSKGNILIISPEPWGINRLSKHHYALAFSKLGYNVFFLNPPGEKNNVSQAEGISIIDYKQKLRGINRLPKRIREIINKRNANRINRLARIHEWNIVLTFDPFRFQNPKLFNSENCIFYSADIHATNMDLTLSKNVHLVLAPSSQILSKYSQVAKRIYFINHGLNEDLSTYTFSSWKPKENINVVYVGNLQNTYIDHSTLRTVIDRNEQIKFTFLGPYGSSNLSAAPFNNEWISFLRNQRNVVVLGSKPTSELPKVLEKADLFLICYNSDRYPKEVSNSHKIIEYLSSGRVVVANHIAIYSDKPGLIEMANTQEELPGLFNQVVTNLQKYNSPELQSKRRQFALENTYQNHVKTILNLIES